MDVEAEVIALVARVLGTEPALVTVESAFVDDLGADSFDIAMAATAVEESFGVVIGDAELGRVRRVGDLLALVQIPR